MDNYSLPLNKCHCANCGKTFGCIKPVWFCKECNSRLLKCSERSNNHKGLKAEVVFVDEMEGVKNG